MGPEIWSGMIFLEAKSRTSLAPTTFLDKDFEWRLAIEWKDGWDEVLFRKILEVESILEWAKWDKSSSECEKSISKDDKDENVILSCDEFSKRV